MKTISAATLRRLEKAARAAAKKSYSPYSDFAVGAAVLAGSGKIYAGCNVENASYGLCNCAERTAIFSAAAAGERTLRCVVVFTPTPEPTMPCGACRQVINEFGPHAEIVSVCASNQRITTTLDALLPAAFGPGDLRSARCAAEVPALPSRATGSPLRKKRDGPPAHSPAKKSLTVAATCARGTSISVR